jgi:hypothetical protein
MVTQWLFTEWASSNQTIVHVTDHFSSDMPQAAVSQNSGCVTQHAKQTTPHCFDLGKQHDELRMRSSSVKFDSGQMIWQTPTKSYYQKRQDHRISRCQWLHSNQTGSTTLGTTDCHWLGATAYYTSQMEALLVGHLDCQLDGGMKNLLSNGCYKLQSSLTQAR